MFFRNYFVDLAVFVVAVFYIFCGDFGYKLLPRATIRAIIAYASHYIFNSSEPKVPLADV
jgi:hypothetical protein